MGQHKHNPTAIAAKNGELPPKKRERRRSDEYQLMLHGVSTLYGENRETATERCYALFWEVQKMQSVTGQLEKCYAMLQMLDCVTNKFKSRLAPIMPLGI